MHVFFDSPSDPNAHDQKMLGNYTSHAYACVFNAKEREWYIQEPLGDPILIKSPMPVGIKDIFKYVIRCDFYAFYLEQLRKVVKQPS